MSSVVYWVVAYLLGSIPTAIWISQAQGKDIRKVGSGNAGATNMIRAFGWKWGLLTFFIDAFKGYLAVSWPRWLETGNMDLPHQLAAGVAVIIGHIFPVWAGFRGGKGVATLIGVMWGTHLLSAAIITGVVVGIIAWKRYVSLGSLVGSCLFAAMMTYFFRSTSGISWVWLFPLIIIWSHRDNIRRLLQGRERKLGSSATRADAEPPK